MSAVTGRRIVITGSSGGFGAATMQLLLAHGARVVGLDLQPASDADIACDISDETQVRDAIAIAVERLGGIDVLINNAGIGTAGAIAEPPGHLDRRVLDVNALGTWNVTAAALPYLLEARGQVINVASLLAVVTLPHVAAYTASKRAVCALSDVLRIEHAQQGLSVSTVYPGYVATPIHDEPERRTGLSLRGRVPEERVEQVARTILAAMQRMPRDIATSRTGAVVLRLARVSPRLVDRIISARLRRHPIEQPVRG